MSGNRPDNPGQPPAPAVPSPPETSAAQEPKGDRAGVLARLQRHPIAGLTFVAATAAITMLGLLADLDQLRSWFTRGTAVKTNSALFGVIELGMSDVWAAAIDPTKGLAEVPAEAFHRVPLASATTKSGVVTSSALKRIEELTNWLVTEHGVPENRVRCFTVLRVEPGPTKSALPSYVSIERENRSRKLLAWLERPAELPRVAVAYFGATTTEIDGIARTTATTKEKHVVGDFSAVSKLAAQLEMEVQRQGSQSMMRLADDICQEQVAIPLRRKEDSTPTRTACRLYLVGDPIDRLFNDIPHSGRREFLQALEKVTEDAKVRYEMASPGARRSRAIDLTVARLIYWIGGKALQSTEIHVVRGGACGWIIEYVKEQHDRERGFDRATMRTID